MSATTTSNNTTTTIKQKHPRATGPSRSLVYVPANPDLDDLANAAQRCQACDLYKGATQAVFGEGRAPARIMLIGEQPGDHEDLEGRPFVGPAGRILDEALEQAEIPRDEVYVTNAVKHFKWEPRGKRRIHSKPNAFEIHACRGWLETEIKLVEPEVIVCLGATAAQLFLGKTFRLTKQRGVLLDGSPWARRILATYHPSAIVRMHSDEAQYAKAKRELTLDLAEAEAAAFESRHAYRTRAHEKKARQHASL